MKLTPLHSQIRRAAFAVVLALCLTGALSVGYAGPFVYESSSQFTASGDFNGDGVPDVLVLDKATGNARVGYGDGNGGLTWSQPLVTGVEGVTGCAVGQFLHIGFDAVAVTASTLNRINLVDLSATNATSNPAVVTPIGIGPYALTGLINPVGGVPPAYECLFAATSDNDSSSEQLDLMAISAGAATAAGQFPDDRSFDRANDLEVQGAPSFAVGIGRGSTDRLDIWQFTNAPAILLSYTNLPSGSDYAFTWFNGETYPRFAFYTPGNSSVTLVPLLNSQGALTFGSPLVVPVPETVVGVFDLLGSAHGTLLLAYADGVQALQLTGGSPSLSSIYTSGAASGNAFNAVVPMGSGNFGLLDGPVGNVNSSHAQVIHFDGANFSARSASYLSPLTSAATRANVFLFQSEPFVSSQPGFLASVSAPGWIDAVTGLPSGLAVVTETDGGAASGLGNPSSVFLAAPPPSAQFALAEQYSGSVSLFNYAAPRPPEPVAVTISPLPGPYSSPIQITFSTLNPSDQVFYRAGANVPWSSYSGAFTLGTNATVEYYGVSAAGARSGIQSASYYVGVSGQPIPLLNLTTGSVTTNLTPVLINTNLIRLTSAGTIFYNRLDNGGFGFGYSTNAAIWSINLDGTSDRFITPGWHPRVSPDGHYLAFMRTTNSFPVLSSQGDLWLRDLTTGQESLMLPNTNWIVGFSWAPNSTNLIFDYACQFWSMGLDGSMTALPLNIQCYDGSPVVNPVDGRIAYHQLSAIFNLSGLWVVPTNSNTGLFVDLTSYFKFDFPIRPEWSPDGQWLAFGQGGDNIDDANDPSHALNLFLVHPDGTGLSQITGLQCCQDGFLRGAIWAPNGKALVGAGSIFGQNGLWVIPITPGVAGCAGPPIRLPTTVTTPTDLIDFAGSVVAAPSTNAPVVPVKVAIHFDLSAFVIAWSTNITGFELEYATNLGPAAVWQPVPTPPALNGSDYEYQESVAAQGPGKFFRLHKQ